MKRLTGRALSNVVAMALNGMAATSFYNEQQTRCAQRGCLPFSRLFRALLLAPRCWHAAVCHARCAARARFCARRCVFNFYLLTDDIICCCARALPRALLRRACMQGVAEDGR